ncbi:bifunctional DNA primase/polymerase [Microbacterium indicum]|uniref:bifunctional DNA primase/polymerase n=1 Tax=Microbacterium indicum TaxID=358100 RepID=UPI000408232F|nr:bifunctional DNA primase/polymerase [Microbacterium indicum]
MTRWVPAAGKRPITTTGFAASSTDPSTWASFAEVSRSTAGDGHGIMLGDGLGCYDLDHTTDAEMRDFLATVTESVLFVERSVSGHGFHIFIEAPEGKGYRRGNLERYTRARFIRVTGEHLARVDTR